MYHHHNQPRHGWGYGCLCIIGVAFAAMYTNSTDYIRNWRNNDAYSHVQKREGCQVIYVWENNTETNSKLALACQGHFDESRPDASTEGNNPSIYFKISGVQVDGFPTPKIIRKFSLDNSLSNYTHQVCYGIFTGKDAFDKLEKWASQNGYVNSMAGEYYDAENGKFDKLEKVVYTKGDSEVGFYALFDAGGRFYRWDGLGISHLSEGFTSNANGSEESLRKNASILEKMAE